MYEGLKNLEVPRRPRRRHRLIRGGLIGLLIFSVLVAGGAVWLYIEVNKRLGKGVDERIRLVRALPDGPVNILIVGSDRRDVLARSEREKREYRGSGGRLADTIMLIHLARDKQNAVLVHFPRDLRVEIPRRGFGKINSAYDPDDPNRLIKVVQEFSGLPIHHYVETNFASFRTIVDAVGGVSMYVPEPLRDARSGLDIRESGCVKLNGETALAFVRARNIYPNADLGRIQTQQRFVRALMKRVKSVGFLLDPGRVLALSKAVGEGLRYNKEAKSLDLARAIANRLAGFDSKSIDFRVVPSQCCTRIGGVSYLMPRQEEADEFFTAIRRDTPLPPYGKTGQSRPDPEDVSVRVLNATTTSGLASREVARLRKIGFDAAVGGNAKATIVRSAIFFTVDSELKAALLKRYYPGARVELTRRGQGVDLILTLGKDAVEQRVASGTPKPKPSPKDEEPPLAAACG